MLFNTQNYRLMLLGVVLIVIGFFLMAGKEDIYGFIKITLAPILIVAGLIIEIYAILYHPKSQTQNEE